MRNYVTINGVDSTSLAGFLIQELPPLSLPKMRTKTDTIDGRDGDIITKLGYSAYDKEITIGLYGSYDIDKINEFFVSEGTIVFSNEPDKYYRFTMVDGIDYDRLVRFRTGKITFHCQPYKYDATETEIDFTNTYTEDTVPYIYRANTHDANMMKLKKVVGGTIAWNQLLKNSNAVATYTKHGLTFTRISDVFGFSVSGTFAPAQDRNAYIYSSNPSIAIVSGHKYLVTNTSKYANVYMYGVTFTGNRIGVTPHGGNIVSATGSGNLNMSLNYGANITNGTEIDEDVLVNLFDLTQMFGSTIADYIYSLEQAHAGDGVAWFKALFGEDYYPYNAGELLSVKTSARKTYNADNVEIGSYALDDNLTLRGIPKLDADHNLYYDGDTYESDGTVTRKYGTVTFNGSETWYYDSNNALAYTIVTNGIIINSQTQHNIYVANDNAGLMSESWAGRSNADGTMGMYYGQTRIYVKKSTITSYSDAKTYFTNNPTNVIYALATPTTESADAYTQSQRVGATEEFVDGRTVEIPVGNNTLYYDGTPEIVVKNKGNTTSRPTLTIYGEGTITVSLNGDEIFTITMGDHEYITIDTEEMNAYMGGVLLNRSVRGDYSSFVLNAGDNTISLSGNVSEVLIDNYSRWL